MNMRVRFMCVAIWILLWALVWGATRFVEFQSFSHTVAERKILLDSAHDFKILQFADLHFGENNTDDGYTLDFMDYMLSKEKPDFVIFSGDQISGFAAVSEERRKFLWHQILNVVAQVNVSFATIFGNHDDQPYRLDPLKLNHFANMAMLSALLGLAAKGRHLKLTVNFSLFLLPPLLLILLLTSPRRSVRQRILEYERQRFPNLSYTGQGPPGVHGTSNYRVLLQSPGASAALYFLDSGGGWIPEGLHPDQLAWLERLAADPAETEPRPPSLAFVHIPPQAFAGAYSGPAAAGGGCDGGPPREPTSASPGSGPLLAALRRAGARAVFAGHDHGNAWCCRRAGVLLCYGRHSGYGGYDFDPDGGRGGRTRGARVIALRLGGPSGMAVETRIAEYNAERSRADSEGVDSDPARREPILR